jgi:choline-sulfatase
MDKGEDIMANVILFMSDEHNPKYSSVYGHPVVQTPNMEKLASQGTLFESAYCMSPLCTPSRAALMTGRRVHEVQAYSNSHVNLNSFSSFGQDLSEQGVHTVLIGKSGFYCNGFDETYHMPAKHGMPQKGGPKPRNPLAVNKNALERADDFGIKEDDFDSDLAKVNTAVQWLKEKAPVMDRPWLLVVNISNPHFPLWNTREFWEMYPDGADLPVHGPQCESAQHPYAVDLRTYFQTDKYTEEQIRGLRRGYFGCVSFVDRQLGRLMDAMEEAGLQENTNFIYSADHGEMLGKFGLWWKSSLYEDSIRVPCIAAGPDFQRGQRIETLVDLLDVQATLFESLDVEKPSGRRGTPLQHIADHDTERVVFSEYHGHGTRAGAYAIRKGDWKLIYYMAGPHQLFHLSEDPHELNNVFTEYSNKAAELETELRKICSPEIEDEKAFKFQEAQFEMMKQIR